MTEKTQTQPQPQAVLLPSELENLDYTNSLANRLKYIIWKPDKLTSVEYDNLVKSGYIVNGAKTDTFNLAFIKSTDSKEIKLPHRYGPKFFYDVITNEVKSGGVYEIHKTSSGKKTTMCPRILSKYPNTTNKRSQTKKPPPKTPKCMLDLTDLIILNNNLPNPLLSLSVLKSDFPKIMVVEGSETKSKKKRAKADTNDMIE